MTAVRSSVVERVDVQPVVDWLLHACPLGERGKVTSDAVLALFGPKLIECGVRVARIAAFVRTLDPIMMGRRFVWKRDVPGVDILAVPHAMTSTAGYQESPVAQVCDTGQERRWRLEGHEELPFEPLGEQRAAGMTDYLGVPLHFLSGEVHAVVFTTDAVGGFTDAELAGIRRASNALARVAEVLSLRRIAANLLDAYVGHQAGERILSGRVRRGETERIQCVIWFSDLRGFTTLSAEREPEATIDILNRLFDCQVPAVEQHGGEVLKFIGDGMLAIFVVKSAAETDEVVGRALAAAKQAFASLDAWNEERHATDAAALRFGLALHVGEVGYGNIGGAHRLDFTCIGPAVNLAARVEGLASKLGKRLLLTDAFAQHAKTPTRSLGAHAVKGVEPSPVVHELADTWSLPPPPA